MAPQTRQSGKGKSASRADSGKIRAILSRQGNFGIFHVRPRHPRPTGPRALPVADFLVLRSGDFRARKETRVRRRPAVRRARTHGAARRRLPDARLDGSRQAAGAERIRRGTALQRLPPSPGPDARRPGQRPEHRLPAASLDLRSAGRTARGAAVRGESVRAATVRAAQELERAAVRRTGRRAQGHPGRLVGGQEVQLHGLPPAAG